MLPAYQYPWVNLRNAFVLATVALASSCTAPSHSLEQVRTNAPSVSYAYNGDDELLRAAQNAETFCRQYASSPGPARITDNPNGPNSVAFECSPNPPAVVATQPAVVAPQPAAGPNLTYSYRNDQELLAASRTAEAYCANTGLHGLVSNITPNADGSKTVTFQCARS